MPLTPEMRRGVDEIRDHLYGGGYPDPVANAEQLAFLFFFALVEGLDRDNALRARVQKQPYSSLFEGEWMLRNPQNAPAKGVESVPRARMRWSSWSQGMSGEALVRFVRDEVFPFYAEVSRAGATHFMDGARLGIDDPAVLATVLQLVDRLGLERADADTKGDLFEHVLRQVRAAGELGQFRTARHLIRAIVAMVDPRIGETVYDPAAGTAGFLVAAYDHIRLANSSPEDVDVVEVDGKPLRRGHGDRLDAVAFRQFATGTFFGNDVDPKMVRLASMNLFLRGLPDVRILRRNVLTTSLDSGERDELGLPARGYDVVLANPPFSGRVDRDRIVPEVRVGTTGQTEILFLRYMLDSLEPGGRMGVVVPEGVLFGSTGAHKELRRMLLERASVEAVLSLPGGAFNPYSGVKTSVLFVRKQGRTERVLFLHADADGYKLDAQHDTPVEADDLPGAIVTYKERDALWARWQARDPAQPWAEKWWFADAEAIRAADLNLSAGRYRPQAAAAAEHRDPLALLGELEEIEAQITQELVELREKLAEAA